MKDERQRQTHAIQQLLRQCFNMDQAIKTIKLVCRECEAPVLDKSICVDTNTHTQEFI